MQPDDNLNAWAGLAHYLRFTPAWTEGSPALPLPCHLAVNALADAMVLVDS
jgi:hypothetical protein